MYAQHSVGRKPAASSSLLFGYLLQITFAQVHLALGPALRRLRTGTQHSGSSTSIAAHEESMYAQHFVGRQPAASSGLFMADFAANFWSVEHPYDVES